MSTVESEEVSRSKSDTNRPMANNFNEYLPWACSQLQTGVVLVMNKIYQNEYVSVVQTERSKGKKSKSKEPSKLEFDSELKLVSDQTLKQSVFDENVLSIDTIYDTFENLVELRFPKLNKKKIPREIFKIIALIIKFQQHLTALTIHAGLNRVGIYELCKVIALSNITDVCLDATVITGANYESLLEHENRIRQLSLARCRIDDDIVKNIASKLLYPLPSSKTLIILNLSINLITDVGAKYLAQALRSNRRLAYLNLASNMLTDYGVTEIFDVLIEFPVTKEELIGSRSRQITYLLEKRILVGRLITELRSEEKNKLKKKPEKLPPSGRKGKGLDKEGSLKTLTYDTSKRPSSVESYSTAAYYEKASNMVNSVIGEFNDPFSFENLKTKTDIVYCCGNNSLCYLNVSYNNLTLLSVQKLYHVLTCQKLLDRQPKGLLNVIVEGNNLPVQCHEMYVVDEMLQLVIEDICNKRSIGAKKKSGIRSK